jgi:hypothetical protein
VHVPLSSGARLMAATGSAKPESTRPAQPREIKTPLPEVNLISQEIVQRNIPEIRKEAGGVATAPAAVAM